MNSTTLPPCQKQELSGPAMELALELSHRGLVRVSAEAVARAIDEWATLPSVIETLQDLFAGARLESDAKAFQGYVLDRTSKVLSHIGYEFSYHLVDDGPARLAALRARLAAEGTGRS